MRHVIAAAALLIGLTACTQPTPDPGPRFDDEATSKSELTCVKHQPHPPGPRYTDDSLRRADETLALLRYYTANGAKPYCDGKDPTDIDTQWLTLYVRLGADRDNVPALLGET